jgi:hypothetical protein
MKWYQNKLLHLGFILLYQVKLVRKICQLALTVFIYRICKDCNFQCRFWVTPKWSKSNNIIIKNYFEHGSCDYVPIAYELQPLVAKICGKNSEMKMN